MSYRESRLIPFISNLASTALADYPALPELLPSFEASLDQVVRAGSMKSQIPDKPNETVLGHLAGEYGILTLAEGCLVACPSLAKEVNLRSFVGQVLLHDWPETVVKDHDHATTSPHNHHLNGNKERAENKAFYLFLLPLITNPEMAKEANLLFTEFMQKETREARFALVFDRLAGNLQVTDQHISRIREHSGHQISMESDRIDNHISRHAKEVSLLADIFADSALSDMAKSEWRTWFGDIFQNIYTNSGHENLPVIQELIIKHRSLANKYE